MKKIYKISIGVILALILVISLSINSLLKGILIRTLEDKTGLRIAISTLWVNPLTGNISSKGIDVSDGETSLLTLKSFRLNSDPVKLLRGTLYIDEITLIEPTIDLSEREKDKDKDGTPEAPERTQAPAVQSAVNDESEKDPFIKEVIVKNITVENLTLRGEETAMKSLSTLSLKVPDFTYREDTLTLTAALEVIDSGILNLNMKVNTGLGELEASLGSPALIINTSIASRGQELNLRGNFDGLFNISGNYRERDLIVSGSGSLSQILISDQSGGEVLEGEFFKLNLDKLRYPEVAVAASGEYSFTSYDPLLQIAAEDIQGLTGSMEELALKGSFEIAYPLVLTSPEIISNNISLKMKEDFTLELPTLTGLYDLQYDLDKKSYRISGNTLANHMEFATGDKKTFFSGDLALDIAEITEKTIHMDRLLIAGGRFSHEEIRAENLALTLKDFTTESIDSPLTLSGVLGDSAEFEGDLRLTLSDMKEFKDLALRGDIEVRDLILDDLKNYAEDLPYDLSGTISYDSYIDYSGESISTRGKMRGKRVTIDDRKDITLSLADLDADLDITMAGEDLSVKDTTLNFKNLAGTPAKGTLLNLPKGSISIRSYTPERIDLNLISLSSPDIVITSSEEKASEKPSASGGKSGEAGDKAAPAPAAKKPVVRISKVNITGGTITQNAGDSSTKFTEVKLLSQNFTTEKNKPFTVDTSLSMKGIRSLYLKGKASLYRDWDFDLKTIDFTGSMGVAELNLPDFNDKFSASLPNKIEEGRVKSSGNLSLDRGKISSRSRITISDLKLGEATGVASRVPLDRVVRSLKDSKGDISVTVPVEGDLNDPEFGVEKIVLEILIANFTEALKTPEKAISTVISMGSSDKENVLYFDYLESSPKADDLPKLDEFIALLKGSPASKIRVTIFTNDKVEKGLMKTQDIAGILFGKKKGSSSDDLDKIMEGRKKFILDYLTPHIDSSRIEVIISDRDKNLPQAKLEIIQ